MKSSLAVLFCLTILGSGWGISAVADDNPPAKSEVPTFYNWLEKYQNPTYTPGPERRVSKSTISQPLEKTSKPEQSVVQPALETPAETSVDSVDEATDIAAATNETAEPGKGLGCFYHRAYYSHLPLFKDGAYTLHGSLDLAEPYHKRPDNPSAASVDSSR